VWRGPNRAHASNRGRALPRRRVSGRIDCLRRRESLIGHSRERDVAVFMDSGRGRLVRRVVSLEQGRSQR